MSELTGWHKYRVLCNRRLIASFMTQALADSFAIARRERWPQNEYEVAVAKEAAA